MSIYHFTCEGCGCEVKTYRIINFRVWPPELDTPTKCDGCKEGRPMMTDPLYRHPKDNGRYCIRCVHHNNGFCMRVSDEYFDLVKGVLIKSQSTWDCAYERGNEEIISRGQAIPLCGWQGRYYERKISNEP